MRSLPMKSEVTQGVKMRESFPVRPAEDLCCSGTHHQQLAPIPTLQLLLAASLPCSGVATSRPALCMSGKPVLTSEIQRTPWKQNRQEQSDGTLREVASALRDSGSAMSACLVRAGLWVPKFWEMLEIFRSWWLNQCFRCRRCLPPPSCQTCLGAACPFAAAGVLLQAQSAQVPFLLAEIASWW